MIKYFGVYKELINLCKIEIYEGLLLAENFINMFKVLEFDPDISFKQDFVDYFSQKTAFNNFLEISDKKLLDKIHLAHRVLCLKESLMSKSFKETTIQILWSYQLSIWNEIISRYTNLSDIRAQLIIKITKQDINAFLFLNEAMSFSKFIPNSTKLQFYEILSKDNILKIIQKIWCQESNNSIKTKRIIIEFVCESYYANLSDKKQQ